MDIITLEDIRESNCIKKETCKSCMEQLKDVLSDDQLKKFEETFYDAVAGVVLGKKKMEINGR